MTTNCDADRRKGMYEMKDRRATDYQLSDMDAEIQVRRIIKRCADTGIREELSAV